MFTSRKTANRWSTNVDENILPLAQFVVCATVMLVGVAIASKMDGEHALIIAVTTLVVMFIAMWAVKCALLKIECSRIVDESH